MSLESPPHVNGDDDNEPFMINDILCELIGNTEQEDGVEVIKSEKIPANEDDNDDDDGKAEVWDSLITVISQVIHVFIAIYWVLFLQVT